ncbi:hypothetical protein ANN_06771 [Periplaneta americana]|uniref:Uncharacterized protein n=1 Tax=Periplaneta americana TaxID=6978 RepID=A0ABQ8TF71_PERAM|nr:hypothetical protein ANN_06771 [Periplaneta americana]
MSQASLQAEFRKTEIFPLCAAKVLECLLSYSDPNVRKPEGSPMTRNQEVEQETSIKRERRSLMLSQVKVFQQKIEKFSLPSTSKIAICSSRKKDSRKAKAVESSIEEDEGGYSLASDASLNLSDIEETFEDTSSHEVQNDDYLPAREEFVVLIMKENTGLGKL